MPRLPDIDPDRLAPEQRRVYDAIVASPRGRVEGPLRVWLTSPDFAERAQNLGVYCRFGSKLPPRLSEIAILVGAAHWRAGFEWWAHANFARAAGHAEPLIEAIRTGATPAFANEDERSVHAVAKELVEQRRLTDATYRKATEVLGTQALVDLVGILGYYTIVAMTIVAFDVPMPPGEPDPFADRA
jgi:4-carboxymuconolactone decarboxylase